MATHSGVLAWRIPGTGEPGGLPSMGSHRVGHDCSDLAAAAAALNYSLRGSSIHGIFQVRVLEWGAVAFCKPNLLLLSRFSRVRLCATPQTEAHKAPPSLGFSRQEYWSGLSFPSPGDLPNPGIKLGLLHCRQILYHLNHQGSLYSI